jgi:hypothetical protein
MSYIEYIKFTDLLLKIYEVNRARIRSAVARSSWGIEVFEIPRDEKKQRA